jgi:hypothetical protein
MGILPIYALSHEGTVAFVLANSVLLSGFAVEVPRTTVDTCEISDRFLLSNFFTRFDFWWLD